MANFLINGFSAKIGGGKVIFKNYLNMLLKHSCPDGDRFFVITPDYSAYSSLSSRTITIVPVSRRYQAKLLLPFFYLWAVPRVIKEYNIDAVLNFGDVILPVKIPQVYFFDWSYAIYPESPVWQRMDLRDYVQRRVKFYLIKLLMGYPATVLAQTATMKRRLMSLYGVDNVVVIPTPVKGLPHEKSIPKDFTLPKGRRKLLCLSNYAPHKNLEVLLPLARLLREKNEAYTVITTIEPTQSKRAKQLIDSVANEGLEDFFVNLGHVAARDVPSLFEQCDALLLPTLLESYGLPFIEAMVNGKTILTSAFDFTYDVCGDAAYYFDPMDAHDIYRAIHEAFSDEEGRQARIELGYDMAQKLNDWPTAFMQYQECLRQVLKTSNG
jgi:glycosyltransferase involved in cell wall biosynthesis